MQINIMWKYLQIISRVKNYTAMITVISLLQHLYMLFTLGQIMAQSITSAKYFLGYIWAMGKFFSTIG